MVGHLPHQVEAVACPVIVCPPSLALKWQNEMREKLADAADTMTAVLRGRGRRLAGLGHTPPVDQHLATLRAAGVRVALDGFGTGHCTLSALYRLPVDEIKIDRGFVADLPTCPKAAALVSSIVELGRRFDLLVTAEGVEQQRQRQALREVGCNHAQGRLFGAAQASNDVLTTSSEATTTSQVGCAHP